ncbi:hypothetical protein COCMIDRAFT_33776 [Bipolaris oryzae ATCC 44560]|uniref:DNA mismatch repair protein S5 domain-containing protein n=1 Tax=Bipolaris oryzae ATCC 44560 TaxID=930090 RepID=W6ZYG6_COCMI|nr:uncharacterized protein COCMIDRAFT_33776 [Bipolaris oryzae ATCC 44560]EUC48701.1 hypothetical protein COCMIDRAFT_33776 [Bipolaris oryzae ATCC 44560]
MADAPNTLAQPSIAALPPLTIRQLGSGQVLIDPSSVVKELIENALDARAKSIFVDITANTIDSVQVKDDGHGIPSEDRSLVCRRYCTSKIRDLNDLRELGGKWLGFRGEALASMAEISGAFSVTTRVEGEPVAVRLKYSRDGELESVAHDSHPVGTTVKVAGFFEHIPVRKQTAVKNAAKCLAKIRRLMQAYALARPSIRLRLRILKAKNINGDFSYAPRAHADVGDAVLKIFGKDCAAQCDFTTVEADGFEIRAFLPKPTAIWSKISGYGSFVAVDARPVSNNRGTIKQMAHAYKQRLGKINPSLPVKDDVMFEDSDIVLRVWVELLDSFYTEAVLNLDDHELSSSSQQSCQVEAHELVDQYRNEATSKSQNTSDQNKASVPAPQPRWRHSMYGIDEEDLEFLQDDRTPIIDEEEGRHAAEVSNPWTIARMNTVVKPRGSASNGQLFSPAKSTVNCDSSSSPSRIPATPDRVVSAEPLTPQTSSKANTVRSSLDDELERSIQRLPPPLSVARSISDWGLGRRGGQSIDGTGTCVSEGEAPSSVLRSEIQAPESWTSPSSQYRNIAPSIASPEKYRPLVQNQLIVSGERIAGWVGRIDGKLSLMHERAGGADEIRVVIQEGVKKGLEGIEWEEEEMLMDL